MVIFLSMTTPFNDNQDNVAILGTWKLEEDHNSKWEFTRDGKMTSTYVGERGSDSYSWSISHKTPQCGVDVTLEEGINFIELIDNDDNSKSCYHIDGLNSSRLTLMNVKTGHLLRFLKD